MYFTYKNIQYFIHWWNKEYYKSAFYIYYKDGDLLFIDYQSDTIAESIEKFKLLRS